MALNAKFIADFESFYSAVQKAEVSLKSFEQGAGKVSTSLTKMGNSLQGTKLIQDATLMAAAVEKIGGTSKLTEQELQRLGSQAKEAVEKMQKLGIGVPQNLQAIANAARPAESSLQSLIGTAGKLAGAFGIGFSVGAVVSFGRELLSTADSLVKLSDKTGVSLQGLQKFQIASDDAGNTVDQLTGAISQMENRLASGDQSAVGALNKLGLSLEDIKRLTPENQFIAISDALRQIQDPAQQTAIAMDLFGRQGAEILPTLKRGFDDVKNAAVGMSDETIRAFDAAGDAISRWYRNVKGATANAIVDLVHLAEAGFNPAIKAGQDAQRSMQGFIDKLHEMAASVPHPAGNLPEPATAHGADDPSTIRASRDLEQQLSKTQEASRKAAEQTAHLKDELIRLKDNADEIARGTLPYFLDGIEKVGGELDTSAIDAQKMAKALGELKQKADELARGSLPFFAEGLEKIGQKTDDIEKLKASLASIDVFVGPTLEQAGIKAATSFKDGFEGVAKGIPDTLMRAFEGGGGLEGAFKSLGAQLGNVLAQEMASRVNAQIERIGTGQGVSGRGIAAAGTTGALAGVGTAAAGGSASQAIGAVGLASAGLAASAIAGGVAGGASIGTAIAGAAVLGAATAGIGLAAVGAYYAIKSMIKTVSDAEKEGRKLEKSFEDAFGGFAGFQQTVVQAFRDLGGADEQAHAAIHALFDAEKEGAEATQKHIDALQGVIDKADELRQAASAFGPSQSELEALAVKAKDVYDFMLRSGQYTAAQLAAALDASAKAQARALGQPEAQATVLSAANQKTIASLKALQAQFQSLSDSVAQEAPEEVMGVIESQTRGQMAALEAQSKELRDQLLADGSIAADELERILSGIEPAAIHVPIEWDIPDLPKGTITAGAGDIQHFASGGVVLPFAPRGSDTVPAMLTPGERVLTKSQQQALAQQGNAGPTVIENYIYIDGKQIYAANNRYATSDLQLRQKRGAA